MLNELSHAGHGNATSAEYLYSVPCSVLSAGGGITLQEGDLSVEDYKLKPRIVGLSYPRTPQACSLVACTTTSDSVKGWRRKSIHAYHIAHLIGDVLQPMLCSCRDGTSASNAQN